MRHICNTQAAWSSNILRDPSRSNYAASLGDNLFLKALRPTTEDEFRHADGAELEDSATRPAKMRALVSSSALAVNFFDAWRDADLAALRRALGVDVPVVSLRFEYKPENYPVGPRSPNLDLMLTLADGQRVAVESKFAEPFRSPGADALLSPKYFPAERQLWDLVGLPRAQQLAWQLNARWQYLDTAQLLKHMLGLANDAGAPCTLIYLWYDTGLPDAAAHRNEIARFADQVAGDCIAVRARTYQEAYNALVELEEPVDGWRDYMKARYFNATCGCLTRASL
jgi:hypothetical protein